MRWCSLVVLTAVKVDIHLWQCMISYYYVNVFVEFFSTNYDALMFSGTFAHLWIKCGWIIIDNSVELFCTFFILILMHSNALMFIIVVLTAVKVDIHLWQCMISHYYVNVFVELISMNDSGLLFISIVAHLWISFWRTVLNYRVLVSLNFRFWI